MIENNMIIVIGTTSNSLATPERQNRRLSSGSIRMKLETISQG